MQRRALLLTPLVLLTACAASPPEDDPFVGWNHDFRTCRAEYAEIDARVRAAGVGDALYYRVPGHPYLRTDRTLASFAREVKTLDEVGGWIRRMRESDQEAREFEYINLGMSKLEAANQRIRFQNCGRALAGIEFFDQPAAFARLVELVQPRDEYSAMQRVLGLHALTAPLMRKRIQDQAAQLEQAYAAPIDTFAVSPAPILWAPAPEADLSLVPVDFSNVLVDELGFPGLTDSQWRALSEFNAPRLWIETVSEHDRLALPLLTADSVSANPEQPQAHYQVSFARFGGQPLIQLHYQYWFKGATPEAPLDGFVWRVTLDAQGQALVYESMHSSGRDHRWYPVQALRARERNGDAKGIPVIAPAAAPAHAPTLRIRAGTHEILRVLPADAAGSNEVQRYGIRRYEALFTLPLPAGGTRSLFDDRGLVRGPHGKDPIGGFSSGIPNAGALRQLGHHPIAHVGRAHFDEPYLLESVFLPPGS